MLLCSFWHRASGVNKAEVRRSRTTDSTRHDERECVGVMNEESSTTRVWSMGPVGYKAIEPTLTSFLFFLDLRDRSSVLNNAQKQKRVAAEGRERR